LKKKNNIFVHTKKKPFMRIKYSLFFLLLFLSCKLFAQEDPRFTFSPWAQSIYNPAALGEKENHLNFIGILRQQTIMMKDSANPKDNNNSNPLNPDNKKDTYTKYDGQQVLVNIDSYIKKINGAVGVMFLKDKNSLYDNIGFKLGYASKFRVRGGKLGIGLQLGFLNIKPPQDFKPIQTDDPSLEKSKESFMDFDISFGIHYKAPNWYVGASGTQLIGGVRISGEKGFGQIPRQLYFTGGYIWNLKTAVPWSVEPHVLLRTNLSTWQMDLLAIARYNGILWFGLSYQLNMGIAVLFGAVPFYNNGNEYLKGLEIGIAYTFATTKYSYLQGGGWGDFELVVRYGLNFYKEKALRGYGSSRHLYKNQY